MIPTQLFPQSGFGLLPHMTEPGIDVMLAWASGASAQGKSVLKCIVNNQRDCAGVKALIWHRTNPCSVLVTMWLPENKIVIGLVALLHPRLAPCFLQGARP